MYKNLSKYMANIEIKGVIGSGIGADGVPEYSFKQFISDYALAKGEPVRLFINSVGGDPNESDKIAAFIQANESKFLSVSNSGVVASAAVKPFLALPFEKRFYNIQNGVALMHFPYLPELTGAEFTAELLAEVSEQMKAKGSEMAKFYAKQTGAELSVIEALMAINEPLTESQLESINFAQIVKFKAVAYFNNNNNNNNMKKEEVEELLKTNNQTLMDKIMAIFKPKFKALMLTDANGQQVDFPDTPEGTMPQVGDTVSAPDGDILMADGSTIVVVGGKVSEIKPKEEESEVNVELEALKAENAQLKEQLATAQAKATEGETYKAQALEYAEVKAQMSKIKSQMDAEQKQEGKTPEKEEKESRIGNLKDKFKN